MSKTCPECGGDRRRLRPEYFNIPAKDMEAPDCFTCKGVGKLKNRRNRMKDEIQIGKYQCENGLDYSDNQQSADDEIRQAFEENYSLLIEGTHIRDNAYHGFKSGYKARAKSAQAEIENIKEWNAKIFKKKDAEIEQFKEKLEEAQDIINKMYECRYEPDKIHIIKKRTKLQYSGGEHGTPIVE